MNTYEKWLNFESLDSSLRDELNGLSEKEIDERFYKNLEFGTGGMRGELGAGTNRMNEYTVRKASAGLAAYIVEQGEEAMARGVVIAYDSRHQSPELALETAKTLGKAGIKVYLFKELRPTPECSFAVRYLHAYAGVVMTASHNPPEYNGYKVYGPDGGQIPPSMADRMIEYIERIEDPLTVEVAEEQTLLDSGLLTYVLEEIDEPYQLQLLTLQQSKELDQAKKDLKIVFTPLHGTGNLPIRDGLKRAGFEQVHIVKEQELPDPNFSTVASPNPEEHDAFELAIRDGEKIGADVIMGTDPDTDRLGVAVRNQQGDFEILTGNQLGALMLHYVLAMKKKNGVLPENAAVIKTIVTSEIGRVIAADYGVPTYDTLTGFKFIGEKIQQFENTGEHTFLFGYEESYGYLIGDFVRDKDAVQAALVAAEVAAYYKSQDKTLYDGLLELFDHYGYFKESLHSITLKGKDGAAQIQAILTDFRANPPKEIEGITVVSVEDYASQIKTNLITGETTTIKLPASNVLKYYLTDGSWFCIRPSGTEPKCKFYFGVKSEISNQSDEFIKHIEKQVLDFAKCITIY